MSTIVFTKTGVAYDSLTTLGGHAEVSVVPKVQMSDHAIYASVGEVGVSHHIIREMCKGTAVHEIAKDLTGEDHNWAIAKLDRRCFLAGVIETYSDGSVYPVFSKLPYAFGTGEQYAYGALAMGASAEQACAAGLNYDIHSGGRVHSITLSEAFRLMKDVPANTLRDVFGKPLPGTW